MSPYTVKQLARLSGVSVRTLHHYDAIALLALQGFDRVAARRVHRQRLARRLERSRQLLRTIRSGAAPGNPVRDPLLARHHAWIGRMWDKA